jgi:hypothetical protein
MKTKYPNLEFYQPPLSIINGGKCFDGTEPLTAGDLDRVYEAVVTLSEVFSVDEVEVLESLAGFLTESEFERVEAEFKVNSL